MHHSHTALSLVRIWWIQLVLRPLSVWSGSGLAFAFHSIFLSVRVRARQDLEKAAKRRVVNPVRAQVERARFEIQELVQEQSVSAHVQRRQPHVQALETFERPEPEPRGPERESPGKLIFWSSLNLI